MGWHAGARRRQAERAHHEAAAVARVVNPAVDAAKPRRRRARRRRHARGVAHIKRHPAHAALAHARLPPQLRRSGLCRCQISRGHHNAVARQQKLASQGLADAARRAGDHHAQRRGGGAPAVGGRGPAQCYVERAQAAAGEGGQPERGGGGAGEGHRGRQDVGAEGDQADGAVGAVEPADVGFAEERQGLEAGSELGTRRRSFVGEGARSSGGVRGCCGRVRVTSVVGRRGRRRCCWP
jgi:hypothetical protein